MKALIFNSGRGSRLGSMTAEGPKCMVKLYNGETILARQLRLLQKAGITEIIITTGPFVDQIERQVAQFPSLSVTLVPNPMFQDTNYIYSMYLASGYFDSDLLLLHGDLVFDELLLEDVINHSAPNLCLFHETKPLPEKDFKGRFENGMLREVSVSIFDADCFAFQPLYKLEASTVKAWENQVAFFVEKGLVSVYAENALNEIAKNLSILGMSYRSHYIEEIDTPQDYERVNAEIQRFD